MKPLALLAAILLAAGHAEAQVSERVAVGPFSIDRTEVTVRQFQTYAEETGTVTAAERDGGGFEYADGWKRRAGWTFRRPFGEAPSSPREPAVHVTWAEARDFCVWAGGRLPTSQEWNLAAYTEMRAEPPAPFLAGRTYEFATAGPADANTSDPDLWPRSAEAGATRPGVNGLYDMGGNVWEWAADGEGSSKRTMGGSWWYGPDQAKRGVNASKPADFYAVYVGFRCAYD